MFYLETLSTFVRHKIILNVFNQKRIIQKISYFPDLFFLANLTSAVFLMLCVLADQESGLHTRRVVMK